MSLSASEPGRRSQRISSQPETTPSNQNTESSSNHRRRAFLWTKLCSWRALALLVAVGAFASVNVQRPSFAAEKSSGTTAPKQAEKKNYTEIEDGLYLGGLVDEPPPGTRAVLNVCQTKDSYSCEIQRWKGIPDLGPAPSLDWLREQVDFVEKERSAGHPVYIHCYAGINRSAMVTTAYLMAHNHWSRDDALKYIRSKRPIVSPIPAFMELLEQWEKTNRG